MDELKTLETVLLAIGAIVTAAKWIVKFIGYIGKLVGKKKFRGQAFA